MGSYSFCTVVESATTSIVFEKNRARFGGNSIFGGKFSTCSYNCTGKDQCQVMHDTSKGKFPHNLRIIPYSNDSKTEVSSPANRICLCRSNKPTSTCYRAKRIAFPGQEFNISLIALGEFNGSIAVIMTARPEYFTFNLDNRLHFLQTTCETFK